MAAAYDNYDYTSYWKGREYEHEAEVVALRAFLNKIPKADRVLEGGCGYGRLVNYYIHRGKKIVLTDSCSSMLSCARERFKNEKEFVNKLIYVHSKIENLSKKFRTNSFDLVLMIRVMHHLRDVDEAYRVLGKLVKPGGYLILEFANKNHSKARFKSFLKGDFTFPFDIFPIDRRCVENIKNKTLPFYNYHPDEVQENLRRYGFKLVEKRSVSNVRFGFLKKHIPLELIIKFEELGQVALAKLDFGPSIFLLLQKTK